MAVNLGILGPVATGGAVVYDFLSGKYWKDQKANIDELKNTVNNVQKATTPEPQYMAEQAVTNVAQQGAETVANGFNAVSKYGKWVLIGGAGLLALSVLKK